MKDRGLWVSLDKPCPSGILQRIERVNRRGSHIRLSRESTAFWLILLKLDRSRTNHFFHSIDESPSGANRDKGCPVPAIGRERGSQATSTTDSSTIRRMLQGAIAQRSSSP